MNFVLNLNKFNTLDLHLSHTGVPMANHWKFILLERKFGINTTSDMSKLLYAEIILKYRKWYFCQISRKNHAIICSYYYPQKGL